MSAEFDPLFARIRAMFAAHAGAAVLKCDKSGAYYLDTHLVRNDGYRIAFGGVEIKKNYVSAHLLPVYAHPEMLDSVSEPLRKRMQGKSCFNFKKVDEALLEEFSLLVDASSAKARNNGWLR